MASSSRNTPQSAFLSQIVRVHTDTVPNQTALDFSKYRKITKETIRVDEEPFWILQSLAKSCEIVRVWSDKLSALCRIASADRERAFFANVLDLVVLRMALRMQDNIERIVLCNALVFHKSQIAYVLTSNILQQIQELANKLKQPDQAVSALLVSLTFLQDANSSQTTSTSSELYGKLREILKEYCQQVQGGNLYAQLSELMMQVRQIALQLKQRLKQCNVYNSSVYPMCIPANSFLDQV